MNMAQKFVEIEAEWVESYSQREEASRHDAMDFHEYAEFHYTGQLSYFCFWSVRPDERDILNPADAFNFSILDFKDGSIAIRRNQEGAAHDWKVTA
jgi:hypothetical protein